jgi:hypothetical protein
VPIQLSNRRLPDMAGHDEGRILLPGQRNAESSQGKTQNQREPSFACDPSHDSSSELRARIEVAFACFE